MTPFRKWVSSNLPKRTNNPNPSPTGKIWFGLYWFGAANRTRTGTESLQVDFKSYVLGMMFYRYISENLTNYIKQLQLAEADLMRQQSEQSQKEQQVAQIIPTTQHILESYPLLEIEEKNRLWKLVLKRVTVYRSPDDKLEVNIYPNLPK